jgi:hypothetical protein
MQQYTHTLTGEQIHGDLISNLPANVKAHINAIEGGAVTGKLSHRPDRLSEWGFSVYVAPEPEPISLEQAKLNKLYEIETARYNEEVAGLEMNGMIVATDRESRAIMDQCLRRMEIDQSLTVEWKISVGIWATIDYATMKVMGDNMLAFVEGLFAKEKLLDDQVNACTTIAEVEAISW